MLALLRTISLRDYRAAPGRLTLMIGGIAIGVALIAALGIVNQSVLANFRLMVERAAGRAALQVTLGTGEVGFDEALVDVVEADPDVAHAFGLVRGTLLVNDESGELLQVFGIDLTSDALDSYDVRLLGERPDSLELLNDPRAIFLTKDFGDRYGHQVGDAVSFASTTGVKELHIRGLLQAEGLATVFGGNLAVMDVLAAERLLGKDRRVDQIDILLKAGANTEVVAERLSQHLPASLSISRPAQRGVRFERVIAAFQAMLDGLSLLCLLAGVFIVYNNSTTAITQRARDLAIVLALGAERRTIFGLILLESSILGVLASCIGVALGVALAYGLVAFVAQAMGVIYQTRFTVDALTVSPWYVIWCLALGTGGAMIAAIGPARRAGGLDPLDLMRADFRERLAVSSPNRRFLVVTAILLVATASALVFEERSQSIVWGNAAALLLWLSAIIAAIPMMSAISRLIRPIYPLMFGFDGRVAVEGLTRSPGRTGVTTAVIALSLTLAVTVSSVARSFRESERNWFILMGDLVVSAIATDGGWLEMPLAGDVGERVRAISGVERVETYRVMQGQAYRDSRIAVVAVSPGFVDTPQFRRQIVEGDPEDAVRAIAASHSDAVVVSDNFAGRFGLSVGGVVELPTPAGMRAFRVAAVVSADYSGDQGSIVMNRESVAELWGDHLVSHFNVFLRDGADLEDVRREIVRELATAYRVKVLTVPQTLGYHQQMVDRAFVFTYAIQLLVVVVTLAGIFDLLTTQIMERQREIGVFQALGAEAPDVARAIRLEATTIGAAGAALGSVLAIGTSLMWVRINFRILIGYVLEHHFAGLLAMWCVILTSLVAMLAGHLAARTALRRSVLESLRCE